MKLFLPGLLFTIVWLAISGSFTIPNLVFGIVVAALSLSMVRHQWSESSTYWRRVPAILFLALLFLKELALSAWTVARLVLTPKMELKPGIFAYPLKLDTDFEITLLANLITLTPGTLSVDVSEDRSKLYVHALDCSDVEATKRSIADGFERRIMEAFRK
ncbi:Na+/H+ antiporter subunit E [Agrobacterium sp. fls2-241-TYG-188a]|uniref:Na+/H+ antiporter subunit E n=1 Tax=Agrobacterium sp. fls2-241-TYG-188a TaxID=3040275 RepID=UPI00254B8C9E|nr:Na+/H+ antiporter subunit E [Agrobacterium sp. fls2-241-TYG-188a]